MERMDCPVQPGNDREEIQQCEGDCQMKISNAASTERIEEGLRRLGELAGRAQ